MKRVASVVGILLIVVSGNMCRAEAPNFLVLRNHGRLVLVTESGQSCVEIVHKAPLFIWEARNRHLSKTTIISKPEGVEVKFKLDIVGPDWLFINLKDAKDGLWVGVKQTVTHPHDLLPLTRYPTYEAFLNDPKVRELKIDEACAMLWENLGQNAYLPDISTLRHTYFGFELPSNALEDQVCRYLIQLMDNRDWCTREFACSLVRWLHLPDRVVMLAQNMNLTPEQQCRIDALPALYEVDVGFNLKQALAHLALNEDEIALMSD